MASVGFVMTESSLAPSISVSTNISAIGLLLLPVTKLLVVGADASYSAADADHAGRSCGLF